MKPSWFSVWSSHSSCQSCATAYTPRLMFLRHHRSSRLMIQTLLPEIWAERAGEDLVLCERMGAAEKRQHRRLIREEDLLCLKLSPQYLLLHWTRRLWKYYLTIEPWTEGTQQLREKEHRRIGSIWLKSWMQLMISWFVPWRSVFISNFLINFFLSRRLNNGDEEVIAANTWRERVVIIWYGS